MAKKYSEQEKERNVIKVKCFKLVQLLIAVRIKQGISTYALSEMTGIAQPNITRMESDRATPGLETLIRIADALNVDITISER